MGQPLSGTVAAGAAVSPSPRLVARRGVSAEPSSGRFRVIRPIVVPTGPRAPDRTRASRSRCSDQRRPPATRAGRSLRFPSVTAPARGAVPREEGCPSSPHPLIRFPSFWMPACRSQALARGSTVPIEESASSTKIADMRSVFTTTIPGEGLNQHSTAARGPLGTTAPLRPTLGVAARERIDERAKLTRRTLDLEPGRFGARRQPLEEQPRDIDCRTTNADVRRRHGAAADLRPLATQDYMVGRSVRLELGRERPAASVATPQCYQKPIDAAALAR